MGLHQGPEPLRWVKGFREDGRDKYVEEAEFRAVYAEACIPIRNAMDLAYLTGQRPADVLKATDQGRAGRLPAGSQGKTGSKLRIALEGVWGLVARFDGDSGRAVVALPDTERGRTAADLLGHDPAFRQGADGCDRTRQDSGQSA
jgi:hypothetical protein